MTSPECMGGLLPQSWLKDLKCRPWELAPHGFPTLMLGAYVYVKSFKILTVTTQDRLMSV